MKILVVGDSCIDNFIYCDINRLCPEAPVPVLKPVKKSTNPGMASNVAANLESLGAKVDVITNTELIEKTRYVDMKSGQMIMRLDEEDKCDKYFGSYESSGYDALVISDYNKGFLDEEDITSFVKKSSCPTFLDTKKFLGDWSKDVDFIKINLPEHNINRGYKHDNLIVTDGKNGATYKGENYPVLKKVKVSNVSGAGDTFMAGLIYAYIKNKNIKEAIKFANECASKVVQERGVTTI